MSEHSPNSVGASWVTNRKPVFNQPNDNIEWAKWSWNPVTGCKTGCKYCYARDIAIRFSGHFNPTFHKERLRAPQNTKVRNSSDIGWKNVFVCSMADLFGDWVPREWIDAVLKEVCAAPQWNFLFLTKNPKRYIEFTFPKNAWLGATATDQKQAEIAHEALTAYRVKNTPLPKVAFLSCEPLKGDINLSKKELPPFDWIIIGGQSQSSQMPAAQPEWEWVESLMIQAREADCKIYFKPNLTVRPKEYPT